MILVGLMGGLGNQLFQYAAGYELSQVMGLPLALDYREVETKKDHGGYMLGRAFPGLEVKIASNMEITKSFGLYSGLTIRKMANRFCGSGRKFGPILLDGASRSSLQKAIANEQHGILFGYWQSEEYFSTTADEIRSKLISARAKGGKSSVESSSSASSVAIHVRRGDYVATPRNMEYHGSCGMEYYIRAVDLVREKVGDVSFKIFSDDIEWCRDEFQWLNVDKYISSPGDAGSIEDFFSLMFCQHQIIANSTYSWWAAWLNPNQSKIVIAPEKWFGPKSNRANISAKSWIKI